MRGFGKTMRVLFFAGAFLAAPFLQGAARSAEGADALYAKGRYKEAEAAYRKLDMDHPSDLRYRYDRGCAAYQAGSLDEARAAFTSAARRAGDSDVKSRALYNLGNTAYKQNDFAGARDAYRQALAAKPDDADARRNLELSLKALAKQKEQKQGQKGEGAKDSPGAQKDGRDRNSDDQGRQQGKDRQQEKNGQDRKGKDRQQGKDGQDRPGKDQQQGSRGADGSKGPKPGQSAGSPLEHEGKQDLSGELKGKNMGGQNEANGNPRGMSPEAAMERKRAEALLDNAGENRARARELKSGQGDGIPVGSGKEW